MAVPTHNDVQFKIRIPADLKKRIDDAAHANSRSTTAEIVATLEKEYPSRPAYDAEFAEAIISEMRELVSIMRSDSATEKTKTKAVERFLILDAEFDRMRPPSTD